VLPMVGQQQNVYKSKIDEARELRRQWQEQCADDQRQAAEHGTKGRGATRLVQAVAGDAADQSATSATAKNSASELFWNLRKAANHPCLLRTHYTPEKLERIAQAVLRAQYFGSTASIKQIRAELATNSDAQLHQVCSEVSSLHNLALPPEVLFDSAKFNELRVLLPKLRADGHRALIFSQHLEMLDLLEMLLSPMGLDMPSLRLDGGTKVGERQEMIDKFQADGSEIFAFLLSTRAGGQGINLTAADTVIIHDLDWNPQLDRQAEDRVHRLGQQRQVTVYRLVTAGSVEDAILQMQRRKKMLGSTVLGDGGRCSTDGAASPVAVAEGREEEDDESNSKKMDVATMSTLIENALGLFAAK